MSGKAIISVLNWVVGASTAALHFSASLKSLPVLSNKSFDLSIVLLFTSIVTSIIRLYFGRLELNKNANLHFLLQGLLAYWFSISGSWTQSSDIGLEKLLDMTLLPPTFTFLAFNVVADERSFKSFTNMCIYTAVINSCILPILLYLRVAVIGGSTQTELLRIQYQVVGLHLATAICILTCQITFYGIKMSKTVLFVTLILFIMLISIGARAAFLGFLFSFVLGPSSILYQMGRLNRAFIFSLFSLLLVISFAFVWYQIDLPNLKPLTLMRIFDAVNERSNVRVLLWKSAVAQSDFIGLGVGGFAPAAGFGDVRRWYPHNLWLEAFVEGGIPGFIIFSGLLCHACIALVTQSRHLLPLNFGITLGLVSIGFAQIFTSSDLGNRMIWFWLGLSFLGSVRLHF